MTTNFTLIDDPAHVELFRPGWSPDPVPTPEIPDGAIWGRVTCVPVAEMPRFESRKLPYGFWQDFTEEMFLRLSCTPRREALRIPFSEDWLARRARYTLVSEANRRFGPDAILTSVKDGVVFVCRSSGWHTHYDRKSEEDQS